MKRAFLSTYARSSGAFHLFIADDAASIPLRLMTTYLAWATTLSTYAIRREFAHVFSTTVCA